MLTPSAGNNDKLDFQEGPHDEPHKIAFHVGNRSLPLMASRMSSASALAMSLDEAKADQLASSHRRRRTHQIKRLH